MPGLPRCEPVVTSLPRAGVSAPRRRRRDRRAAVAALLVLAGTFGCSTSEAATAANTTSGDDTAGPASSVPAPSTEPEAFPGDTTAAGVPEVDEIGTYAVGSDEFDVVDDSRTTDAWGGQPELPERTMPTLVLYPSGGPAADVAAADVSVAEVVPEAPPQPGPWPLIVFSHGRGGTGPAYINTLKLWASAGYVVVVPTYPLTSALTPGTPKTDDLANQPADVSFLIDGALDRGDDDPLAGLIDPDRIGLAGHSLGGFTSLAAAYNPKLRDERVDAVAEWAGSYVGELADGGAPVDDGPPLLIIHGDADGTVGYSAALATAAAVGPPWGLITLIGGEHIPPYLQGLGDPYSTVVAESTLDFFDATLKDDPAGEGRLKDVVDEAGPQVATFVEAED